jgi:hypothetical protein
MPRQGIGRLVHAAMISSRAFSRRSRALRAAENSSCHGFVDAELMVVRDAAVYSSHRSRRNSDAAIM